MNLGQLKTDVRDLLRDNSSFGITAPVSGDANTFSDTQVVDAINFAVRRFAELTRSTFLITSPLLAPSADGTVTIPTDHIKIEYVTWSGKMLDESWTSLEYLKNPTWLTQTGDTVLRWTKTGGSTIKLTPIIIAFSTPTLQCGIQYIQSPTLLVADADNVDSRIPEYEQHYLKYAAGWYLLQMDNDQRNQTLADKYMQQFQMLITQVRR